MITPAAMLDIRAGLIKTLRIHDQDPAYLDLFQRKYTRHPDMLTGRINYIISDLTHTDTVRWLQTGELYLVTPAMTAVVAQAAGSKPPYRLHHDDLPSNVGLVIWDPHITIGSSLTTSIVPLPYRGFLWAPCMTKLGPGVCVIGLTVAENLLSTPAVRSLLLREGVTLDEARQRSGPWTFMDPIPLTFGVADQPATHNTFVSAVISTWLLMQQRISVTTTERIGRPGAAGPAGQRRPPPKVRVITLRRAKSATDPHHQDGQAPTREYHHQWVVSGHWRDARVGKGRTERRLTWVTEHVKGPEGAPMIGGERVYAVRR